MAADISEQILKEVSKEFGEDLMVGAQTLVDVEKDVLSVSPSLDIGLNGGIPVGSWVVVGGKPKVGKTTTILSFAALCQQRGMYVYYFDVENRLKKKNILGCAGLDYSTKGMRVIRSRPPDKEKEIAAHILTAQQSLTIAEKVLRTHPNCLVIFDSFSMLLEEAELDGGIGTSTRGGGAKLLAQFCRQMAPVVPMQKSVVLGVVHLMANTSGYGASILEKSGNAVQYQLDVKLRAKGEVPWTVGGKAGTDGKTVGGKVIGQKVTWEVTESALGAPGRIVESYIRYGVGVDHLYETFILGEQLGLIEKSGSWYSLPFLKDVPEKQRKAQGGEKIYQLLKDNPEWAEKLRSKIKVLLGVS